MKIKNLYLFVVLASLFIGCSNEKPAKVASEKKKKLTYSLSPEYIFRSDSITASLGKANAAQKAESRKLFMNGLDLLANKNNPLASIEFFKEAICYYPDEKNYTHLFQAYIQSNQPALADSSVRVLWGKLPDYENSYNYALIAALTKDTSGCVSSLNEAIMMGFMFKDRIANEKLFDFIRDNRSFQSVLLSISGDDDKLRKLLFTAFLKVMPDIETPYELPVDSVKSFNFDKYINYDFASFIPGMEDTRFSRDVSNEYQYVGKFKTTSGFAFIYKSYQMIADTLNPVHTNLVLYDTLGKVIANREIACFCSPIESRSCLIDKELNLEIKNYKMTWQFDPLEKGYAGNKITSAEEVEKLKFLISKENTLEEVKKIESVASSGN